jgi:Na+/melibiose symporter-like transporter
VFASAGSYFNATITTIEKRYKIPSKNMGVISVGNDVSSLFLSVFIAYYGGKSNRPRWISIGLVCIVLYCIMTALPHFLYGSGNEALSLTVEYGAVRDDGQTYEAQLLENRKHLCRRNGKLT